MTVFWLEDDWHNCTAELAHCNIKRIQVAQYDSLRKAHSALSNISYVTSIRRFVFDVNLQIFDSEDLAIFDRPTSPEKDLIGPAFFDLLARTIPDLFTKVIRPKSVFYTKLVAPARLDAAEKFARMHSVKIVRKQDGINARKFITALDLEPEE
ncbi:MAG: hypothetical protein JNM47_02625 [Hyphomonadaceae bacterium]|nr:hypothetical protein [Hyphomonadaceae bacterium]